jgi:hypothetical protein
MRRRVLVRPNRRTRQAVRFPFIVILRRLFPNHSVEQILHMMNSNEIEIDYQMAEQILNEVNVEEIIRQLWPDDGADVD